jgi:hypothetical protein
MTRRARDLIGQKVELPDLLLWPMTLPRMVMSSRVANVAKRIVASDAVNRSNFQLDISEAERILFSLFPCAKQEKEGNANHISDGEHGIICVVVGKPRCCRIGRGMGLT